MNHSALFVGVSENGLMVDAECNIKGKKQQRKQILLPFPCVVKDEIMLNTALVLMASNVGKCPAMIFKFKHTCSR